MIRPPSRRAACPPTRRALLGALRRLAMLAALAPAAGLATAGDARQLVSSTCASCHGADGNSTTPSFPKLAGQPAAYLVKQIGEFYAGTRTHSLITPTSSPLAPEDVTGVANYFSQQKPTREPAAEPTLTEIGKLLYTIGNPKTGLPSCDGCHSPDGSGGGRFPRLAGQHRDYIVKQLNDIRAGRRNSSTLMRAVADRMGDLESRALAAYLSAL